MLADRRPDSSPRAAPARARLVIDYVDPSIGRGGPGLLVDLPEQFRQVPQAHPRQGGGDELVIRGVPAVFRQLIGPLAHDPGLGLGQVPGGHGCENERVVFGAADPRGVGYRRAPGHAGLVDQPGPRAVLRVRARALGGGERAQHAGPRRRPRRGGPFQHPQAPRLLLRRHRGRISRGQVAHRRLQHLQRLAGAGGRHHAGAHHDAHLLLMLADRRTDPSLPGSSGAGLGALIDWSDSTPGRGHCRAARRCSRQINRKR